MFGIPKKEKEICFISGLPRSGSTLLSAILKQNSDFYTSISDPLLNYVNSIIHNTASDPSIKTIVNDEKLDDLLHDLIKSYYKECNESVIFNTNRHWTNHTHLLKRLFPNYKMIVCLRDIPWVIDSVERLHRRNTYSITPMVGAACKNVYERAHWMMGNHSDNSANGFIVEPLFGIKNALASSETDNLLFLDYDALVKYPQETIKRIYAFLEKDCFNHDFDNVSVNHTEYDEALNCEGLHKVRAKVEYKDRVPIIPQDLWNLYMPETVWKFNHTVLNDKQCIFAN